MSFFPPDVDRDESEPYEPSRAPWWGPPNDELPVLYGVSRVLALTEHVAVALIGARVYRDGVEFRIERRLRRHGLSKAQWRERSAAFMEHWPGAGVEVNGALRYGVSLADGQQVLEGAAFAAGGDPAARPAGHVLTRSEGGSSGDNQSFSGTDGLWLWPGPPAGTIELVFQWPAMGIAETRAELDADPILELARLATPLWTRTG